MDRSTGLWVEIVRTGLPEPPEVHQAIGMVIGQLAISPTDALGRLPTMAGVIDSSLRVGTAAATAQ